MWQWIHSKSPAQAEAQWGPTAGSVMMRNVRLFMASQREGFATHPGSSSALSDYSRSSRRRVLGAAVALRKERPPESALCCYAAGLGKASIRQYRGMVLIRTQNVWPLGAPPSTSIYKVPRRPRAWFLRYSREQLNRLFQIAVWDRASLPPRFSCRMFE